MKPQFKREEIYLDLSKLSEEQQGKISVLINGILNLNSDRFLLSFNPYNQKWELHKYLYNGKELTYSQFLDMMGESEEVLQVENNGWIKILSETDLPKEVDQYWFASHNNKIEIRFYNPDWINDRVQFRHRYTHYQPIVKPLPPKL